MYFFLNFVCHRNSQVFASGGPDEAVSLCFSNDEKTWLSSRFERSRWALCSFRSLESLSAIAGPEIEAVVNERQLTDCCVEAFWRVPSEKSKKSAFVSIKCKKHSFLRKQKFEADFPVVFSWGRSRLAVSPWRLWTFEAKRWNVLQSVATGRAIVPVRELGGGVSEGACDGDIGTTRHEVLYGDGKGPWALAKELLAGSTKPVFWLALQTIVHRSVGKLTTRQWAHKRCWHFARQNLPACSPESPAFLTTASVSQNIVANFITATAHCA